MQSEKKVKTKQKKKTKIFRLILILLATLILLVAFLLPAFISSEKGRKTILAKINNSIDGRMDFAGLTMGWLKGIKITDISFNDSSGRTSLAVKQISTKPHYASILTGSLSFGRTVIDEPRVEINLSARQAGGDLRRKSPANKTSQAIVLPIKRIDLVINNGSVKVTTSQGRSPDAKNGVLGPAKTIQLSRINSHVNLRPPGRQTIFDIALAVVDNDRASKISVKGQITPDKKTGWSLKGTSGDLTIEINDLDIGSLAPLFTLAGVDIQAKGSISANVKSKIKDGRVESLSGTIKGKNIDITGAQLKHDRLKTSILDIDIKLQSRKETINIENLQINSDWLTARVTGDVPKTFKSLAEFVKADSTYNLKADFECDLAALLSQMPRTLGVRDQMQVTSGQLSGNIETFAEAGRKEIHGQARLVGLAGVVDGKTIALTEPVTADVRITSDKTGIKYDRLNLSAAFANINCTGTGKLLKYSADVNLEKLQHQLGQFADLGPYQMAGELFSQGTVATNKEKITAAGSLTVKNLRISSTEGVSAFEPQADIDFSVDIERNRNIVDIDFIKTSASFGRVDIKDSILPLNKKADKPMKLVISASNIDLQKLQPFAVLFASFPKQMQLAGTAQSEIYIDSKNDTYRIVTDATHIKNLKITYPQQQPFEQDHVSLIFDAEFNPVLKTIAVKKLQLISPQIKILKGRFSRTTKADKTRLQGQVDCEYDWSAVSAMAAPYLPKGLKLHGQRKDSISFASEYPTEQTDQLMANLYTKASLGFTKADYMGLNFGPTDVDIQIQNGLLKIAPFSTTVNNGQLNFAGLIDFKQKPTLLKTPKPIQIAKDIQINNETTRKLLIYINPVFANAFNVSGVLNFNCERLVIPLAEANLNDIEVIGTVSINKLRLQTSNLLGQILSAAGANFSGQEITIHPTRIVLRNGFLRYDDMQMDIGGHPFNFKGVIGLDKTLNMTVTLPYTLKGRTARVDKETVGERITLQLRGTLDKPELDLGKLLEEQLKRQLRQHIKGKALEMLEGLFKK